MSFRRWLSHRLRRAAVARGTADATKPLREFVYLDEVSLRSLLSSQTGEVTDTRSEQRSDAQEAQFNSSLGANAPLVGKAEIASRFQTSNSSTLQTSRKATVQSWFREFIELPNLRLIEPIDGADRVTDAVDLFALDDPSTATRADDLTRGSLVEFRVRLSADPVFHVGTIVTEFSTIFDGSPELFAGSSQLATLGEAQRVNKVVQQLLAGLIPVRAEAVDHVVVQVDGVEFVVRRDAVAGMDLPEKRLEIVGVTEHLAYWKDIRRVLFSDAEFTMLCRVARGGLHDSWTPVKLADLFRAFAPDMVDQINAASRTPFLVGSTARSVNTNELLLGAALSEYKDALLRNSGLELTAEQEADVNRAIDALRARAGSVTAQRSAFDRLSELLYAMGLSGLDPAENAALRAHVRSSTGLPLFPALSSGMTTSIGVSQPIEDDAARLLDVEVVAVYW